MAVRESTVFVLGAGASRHLGFPLGETLKRRIVAHAPTWPSYFEMAGIDAKLVSQFVEALKGSPGIPIDEFLSRRHTFSQVGKLAIAKSLGSGENPEQLFALTGGSDWYAYLFARMGREPGVFGSRCAFITLNYDRSLEEFLYRGLMNAFGLDPDAAAQVVNGIPIVHLFGQLGRLSWQPKKNAKHERPYGVADDAVLARAAADIVTLHEPLQGWQTAAARDLLSRYDHVVFLGVGYHPGMLDQLLGTVSPAKAVGTAYELPESDVRYIAGRGIQTQDRRWDCTAFLQNAVAHIDVT